MRITRSTIICLLLCITISFSSAANEVRSYYFTHIDGRMGLSENCVKSIVQDHWGFIWFGTKNGLNRYDGNTIKRYNCDDMALNRGNHNISALYEDKDFNLWVGTDKGVYIYNPYTELFSFFGTKTTKGEYISNWISFITGDNDGNIWIITPNQGAFKYNTKSRRLKLYTTNRKGESKYHGAECICVRKNGDVWIGTNGAGLFRYDKNSDRLKQFLTDKNGNSLKDKNIYTICDYDSWIVVGVHEEKLLKFNPQSNILAEIKAPRVHYKIIRSLLYSGKDLYVGTQDGLFIINESKGTETQINENDIHPYGLSDNMIYSLYEDRDHGIWVGTMMSGVDYLSRKGMLIDKYVPMGDKKSLSSKRIREMIEDPNGNIWIASEEGDINIFHPNTQTFENLNVRNIKGGGNRLALLLNDNEIWSGIFKNGLDVFNVNSHQKRHYSFEQLGLNEGSVYALFKDSKKRIWLGTGGGLYIQTSPMKFKRINGIGYDFVQDIAEDKNGMIWIATIGNGIYCYNPENRRIKNFMAGTGENSLVTTNSVSSITIDHKGNLWFSSDRGGIYKYDINSKRLTTYSVKDGLPDDVAYKILEDNKHNLWFGTNQGLVKFNPENHNINTYRSINGLLGNQYNYKSALKTREGRMFFGGTNGLISFNPNEGIENNTNRKVYITNLRINSEEVQPEKDKNIKTNILHSDDIRLPYDRANLSFDFASLNFSGTESDNYEYMMEGIDKNWIQTQTGRGITYSQLPPGKYILKVKVASADDSDDNITSLKITILPPWWLSTLAIIIYALIIIGSIVYILFRWHEKQKKDLVMKQHRFEEEKDKELLRAKISFFTDITHEIRTPLTLINGSLENIQETKISNQTINKNLNAIAKNCKRLMSLINQLLDFRKVDENCFKLNFTRVNVCKLISDIIERFEPTIQQMHKTISLEMEEDDIVIPVDREALTKIMSNMLNNARKYSETFIQVHIRKNNDMLEVSVQNDGDRIPADQETRIFEPFVQLDNSHKHAGSGIGLPLARSLAELHKGNLVIDSKSEYNNFILSLPLTQENVIELKDETSPAMSIVEEDYDYDTNDNKDKENSVLIVEDNEEVMQLITDKLTEKYNIITALNGKEGLEQLKKNHIDIIISDIMMPVMDGFEFCKRIKEDVEINHIPIIMLTARQGLDTKIEGLKAGADAYIEKPFSFNHLITQIETLLSNRQRERESFIHKPYLPLQNSNINKADEQFLSKISSLIIKNIEQVDFNVEQLAEEMCMSRSSLHRKIKEVSSLTPIDFIRLIRLKKAAELISENNYRSSEVCEMVGISSPSYFIKLFQKQFGMTPKEFASKKKEQNEL